MAHQIDQRRAATQAWGVVVAVPGALLYATVLFYAYRDYVQPVFDYDGLTFRDPDRFNYTIAVGLVVALAALLPQRLRRPSDTILWLFFVTTAAPAILLAQYTTNLEPGPAMRYAWAVAACVALIRIGTAVGPRFRLVGRVEPKHVWAALIVFAIGTYTAMIATLGFTLRWVDPTYVYNVRSDYTAAAAGVPLLGYALPIVFNVINPTFIARGVYSLRWHWVALGAGGQALIYMTIGLKSVLFSTLGILAVAWLFRRDLRPLAAKLMVGMVGLAVAANLLDRLIGGYLFDTLFLRRFIVIPGFLPVVFVGIFDSLPKNGFAGTPLFWEDSVYDRGPTYIVGEYLTGNSHNNANASLLGHGYWNAGVLGMLIEAGVLVLLLWLLDSAAKGLPAAVTALIVVMPAFAISSTSIFTVVTSHGFAAAIMVLAVLPRTGWGKSPTPETTRAAPPRGTALRAPSERRQGRRRARVPAAG